MALSRARGVLSPTPARYPGKLLLLGLGLCLAPSALFGQQRQVRFEPRSGEEIDERLSEFLEGSYALWTRDSVVTQDQVVDGDLLVLEGAVRIAGTVTGSVFVVDGDLFLRPGAVIEGDLVVIGGGYYSSSLATVEGEIEYRPSVALSVLPDDGGYLIYFSEEPLPVFEFHGLYGFGVPTYQRVDAVTLSWGATLRVTGWDWRPDLSFDGRFKTGPAQFDGSVRQFWYPSRKLQFGWEIERATLNNEGWIWGTLVNSLSYFFAGEDVRNYYLADRASVTIERPPDPGLSPSFTFQWEDADSLQARDYFVLFPNDSVQANPPIDPGETVSGIFSLTHRRKRGEPGVDAAVTLEGATESLAGDFSFLLAELRARWDHPTVAGQQLKLFLEARGDLAGSLPRQRWSAFGGVGTLPTFTAVEFRGPRLLFGGVSYFVPLLPWASESAMINFVAHARGGAVWNDGGSSGFESNLIFGIRVFFAEAGVAIDPRTGRVVAELVLSGDRKGGIVVP
jgi:hypothetical protein